MRNESHESTQAKKSILDETQLWPEGATAEAYTEYAEPLEVIAYSERKQEYSDAIQKWDDYISSATAEDSHTLNEDELHHAINMREQMKQEFIEASSNYPGDWTSLLYNRMADPVSREKFITQRQEAMLAMKDGEVGMFDKPKQFKAHYQKQIEQYDETKAKVFSYTKVSNERPNVLGTSTGIGDPGTVYSGAHHEDGTPLTPRQKNIIEAHEKGHSMRDFESPIDSREISSVIDTLALDELTKERRAEGDSSYRPNYIKEPVEIIERMAQFKNYFGMTAEEQFTKGHLDHIRKRYVTDTGLDNSVTYLLRCITPSTEPLFLKVINKYPI